MQPNLTQRLSALALAGLATILIASSAFAQFSVTNPAGITINDQSTATPFPSTVGVSNVVGTIEKVTVTLNNINHRYPDDIDVLLVGPLGEQVLLWSDAGGGADLGGVSLTFDSAESATLPDDTQIVSGAYKPSNYEDASDAFGTLTGAPWGTDLGVFAGDNPNGTWSLYVVDDGFVDGGSIASWTLTLATTPVITSTNAPAITTPEDTPVSWNVVVNDSSTDPGSLTVTATSSDQNVVTNTAISVTGSGVNRTITLTPKPNVDSGSTVVTVSVSDGRASASLDFTVTVTPVNDAPYIVSLSTNAIYTTAGVLSEAVTVVVADVDSDVNSVLLGALSSNPAVVDHDNVFFSGTGATRSVTVAPTGAATGTATITLGVTDGLATNFPAATFTIQINPVTHAVAANTNAVTINDFAVATPYPSTIQVANVSGAVGGITAVLADVNHPLPEDIGALLVGPAGQQAVLMRRAGGTNALANGRLTFSATGAALPDDSQITTGTYQPHDYGAGDFTAPAPTGPYTADLSVFNGTNPNGTWSLYVYDMFGDGAGVINGGWLLNIYPAPTISNLVTTTNTLEDTPLTIAFNVGDYDGTVTNVTAVATDPLLFTATTTLSGNNASVTINPVPNANGTNTVVVTAQDSSGFTVSQTVTVGVVPVNDAPTISVIQKQDTTAGVPVGPIPFTVGDVETADPGTLAVSASTSNAKVLPRSSIVLGGTGANRTVTLFPVEIIGGVADVTITVTDGALSASRTFTLTVAPPANPMFANAELITLNDNASATPYPSTLNVSGLLGKIASVKVKLLGFNHTAPDEVDILLQGPTGKSVLLMSDAGGTAAAADAQLIFDDDADAPVADAGPLASGSYQLSNYEGVETLPGTTNLPPSASLTEAFAGTDPNGTWSLYVVDDTEGNRGATISGGWQLSIVTSPSIQTVESPQTTREDEAKDVRVTIGDSQPGVEVDLTATASGTPTAGLVKEILGTGPGTAGARTITIVPNANVSGTNTITVTATSAEGSDTKSFVFIVTPVDDSPLISAIADRSTPAGMISDPIPFTVSDAEGASVTVTATSSDKTLVPDANIVIGGSGSDRTLTITPVGILDGQTTITVTATDGTSTPSTETFVLTVTRNLAFAAGAVTIRDNGIADPYPSTVNVAGVSGLISRVTVTLLGFSHPYPDDVDILLVAPDNTAVMLLSDAGGGFSASNLRITLRSDGEAMPDDAALSSTAYAPADYEPGDSIPSAPAGPYTANLGQFVGKAPNGLWKLYVVDDTFPDAGSLAGWYLILETSPTIAVAGTVATAEDTPVTVNFSVADSDTVMTNLVVTAYTNNSPTLDLVSNIPAGGLELPRAAGADRSFVITNTANASGTNTITLTVTDGSTLNTATFQLVVTPVDDPPTIATATNAITIAEDSSTSILYTIADVDSTIATTNITVVSSDPAVVPNSTNNIGIARADGDVTVTVAPAANANGVTVLTFSVKDATTTVTHQLTLTVTPVNDPPTISAIPAGQSVQSGMSTTNIAFTVGDVETPARDIVVTAKSGNQALIPDSNLLLGGSGADRTIQATPIGTATGDVAISLIANDGTVSVTNTFTLTVTAAPGQNFANTAPITIRDNASATNYPSTIDVTGMVGGIHRVIVTLDGIAHTAPADIDVLLVSPGGQKVVLMSDVGGRTPVTGVRLRFDDNARSLSADTPLVTGTNAPTNVGTDDTFPSPAPAGPYATALSAFAGVDPNGTWSLYVVDDSAGDAGQIALGWSLTIETAPTIAAAPTSITTTEDTVATVTLTIGDMTAPANTLEILVASTNSTLLPPGNISLAGTGVTRTATLRPATNEFGATELTFTVRRPTDGATSSVKVPVTFTAVNDPPQISRLTTKQTFEDVPLEFNFIITDVDTVATNLSLVGTSSQPSVIANTNILFFGLTNNVGTLTTKDIPVTLRPNPDATGTSQITFTVTDKSDGAMAPVSSTFDFVVNTYDDPPVVSSIANQVAQSGGSTPAALFTVTDPDSSSVTFTVTSSDEAYVKKAKVAITPAGGSLPGTATNAIVVTAESGITNEVDVIIALEVKDASSTVAQTFTVTVRPTRERVFANNSQITINPVDAASPYPSQIAVDGLAGNINKVVVRLNEFAHRYPSDVDVLLVSPAGQKVLLMSDAGGSSSVTNINLVFDDDAASSLAANSLPSGTFKPTSFEGDADPFPSPAPAPAYSTNLSAFRGSSPNGTWSLYVVDDTATDGGVIKTGWSLTITTEPKIEGLADTTVDEDTVARVPFTIAEESFVTTEFTFTAASTNAAVIAINTNTVAFTGAGTNWTLNLTPVANGSGVTEITITAKNSDNQTVSGKFQLTVTAVNDQPTITDVADITLNAGTASGAIAFDYSDVETPRNQLILTKVSSNPTLIPENNIVIVGTQMRIVPVGNLSGTSEITLTVTDLGSPSPAQSNSTTFLVNVLPAVTPLLANTAPIVINPSGAAGLYPSTILVDGVEGTVSKVTVTLADLSHSYPTDLDILLVGPQGQTVMLMSDAGGGGGSSALSRVRLTFDDAAAGVLPETPISSGTYKPSNYDTTTDNFTEPAPAGPYGTALSVFNGIDPNGTWSLFIMDDQAPDGGSLDGGWILSIITTSPVINPIADVTTDEDVATTVTLQFSDSDTPATNLVVEATAAGSNLLELSLEGEGFERTLTISPLPDQTGSDTVTVSVSDGSVTNTASFTVTVTPVNDAPSMSALTDQTTPANRTLLVPFTVADVDTDLAEVTAEATSSNTSLGTVSILGEGAERQLSFVPNDPLTGNTLITVVLSDGELSVTNTLLVEVVAPVVIAIDPLVTAQVTDENVNLAVPFNIVNAASDEVQVTGTGTPDTLIAGVAITGTGMQRTAEISLVPNAWGSGSVTLVVADAYGSFTNTFEVLVREVNDPPTIGRIPDQQTDENVDVTIALNVADADTDRTNLVLSASSSNSGLVAGATFADTGTGFTATINLVPNANGFAAVTISVFDGKTTASTTFALLVNDVRQPPTLAEIGDVLVAPGATSVAVPLTVADPDTDLADLVITGTSDNAALVSAVTVEVTETTATANVALVANTMGAANVTISVTDGTTAVQQTFRVTVARPAEAVYGIGLNFGADRAGGALAATETAGVAGLRQANWNNLNGATGTNTTIVADEMGTASETGVTVSWTCNNLWASTGAGEENNAFAAASDKVLMTGYLDTGNSTTTTVDITGLPTELTEGNGYDVYVYTLGGTAGRGGGYRILAADGTTVLKDYVDAQSPQNPTEFSEAVPVAGTWAVGSYIKFTSLTADSIRVVATTTSPHGYSGTPRAPINAIQLVLSSGAPPPVFTGFTRNTDGSLTITWTGGGSLQVTTDLGSGVWQTVTGATSPYTFTPEAPMMFGRIVQ